MKVANHLPWSRRRHLVSSHGQGRRVNADLLDTLRIFEDSPQIMLLLHQTDFTDQSIYSRSVYLFAALVTLQMGPSIFTVLIRYHVGRQISDSSTFRPDV